MTKSKLGDKRFILAHRLQSLIVGKSRQQGLEADHIHPQLRAERMDVCMLSAQPAKSRAERMEACMLSAQSA